MSADTFLLCRNCKKSGQPPIFILMIARKFISAAVASFSGLPPDSMSAVQHRRIPHFASQSDDPASLFLFFCTRCKLLFSRKAVVQILHSDLLPSEFSHPEVLKMLPLLLCEERFHHDVPHRIFCCNLIYDKRRCHDSSNIQCLSIQS